MKAEELVLRRPLTSKPVAADFDHVERHHGESAPDGKLLVRVIAFSLDPYLGQRLQGIHMGEPAPAPGTTLPGFCVGEVLHSGADGFTAGDRVVGEAGWATIGLMDARTARKVDPALGDSIHLGLLGMPGLTAWAGTCVLAKVAAGDIFSVDAAAGAVGGTAGQIARLMGARTVGIAGGPDKCRIVTDRYGLDACIDYRADGWTDRYREAVGGGASVHFENVGPGVLTPILPSLALGARIVLCGIVPQPAGSPATIPMGALIGKRAHVHGLVVYDHYSRLGEWVALARPWVEAGRIGLVEDVARGLDAAPAHFERLLAGRNEGKAIVRLADA